MTIPPIISIRIAAWGAAAALAVIGALSTALWVQNVRLRESQASLVSVRVDIRECRNRIQDFKRDVAVQNEKIEALRTEQEKKRLQAEQELATANKKLRAYETRLDQFAAAQRRPTPPGATCQRADSEIRAALKK